MTAAIARLKNTARIGLLACAAALGACASAPPVPDWQLNAKGALDRAAAAYLSGNARVEAAEFARARAELARTGRADLLAAAELTRCAWRVASLVFDDCSAFAELAADASDAERAYAAYLAARPLPASAAGLLPPQHQALATGDVSAAALAGLADPLAQLVAAGAALRGGRAEPGVMTLAADTASAQGWSRPLLAWLGALRLRAEAAGDVAEMARLQRRIARVAAVPTNVKEP